MREDLARGTGAAAVTMSSSPRPTIWVRSDALCAFFSICCLLYSEHPARFHSRARDKQIAYSDGNARRCPPEARGHGPANAPEPKAHVPQHPHRQTGRRCVRPRPDGGLAYAVAQPARRTDARAAACTQDSEGRAYVQRTPHATHPATQALRGAPELTGQTIEYRGIQSSSPRMSRWTLSVGRIRRSSCREQTWYCDVTTLEARPGSALHALHVVHDAWDGTGLGGPSSTRLSTRTLRTYLLTYGTRAAATATTGLRTESNPHIGALHTTTHSRVFC
eukprot:scaffold16258_cov141-Isochrysis_galbana.AAC.5